jgi:glycosyltransferase involved in cell wall biosynthesis
MFYFACFVLGFSILQFLVVIVNVIFEPKLPQGEFTKESLISVLIPARNEENNIGNILNDLIHQNYRNIEIIIFNDQSDDQTAQIVNKFVSIDNRISLINSNGLPEGWLGKNYACSSLSSKAKGNYYLFMDADVRISGDIILDAISYSEHYSLGLLSIFPKQIIQSRGEKATVPNMNYILLSLLPLILVRKSKNPAFAAANGQFMFFNAQQYKSLLPHERMKDNKVEDIAIAKFYKKNNIPVSCLVGNDEIRCRMYFDFVGAVNGFSKNVIAFFGNSFILAILFWLTISIGFVAVVMALPLSIVLFYGMIYFLTRILISRISKQKIFDNLLYLIPQLLSCGIFIYKALLFKFSKEYQWKGRSIQ